MIFKMRKFSKIIFCVTILLCQSSCQRWVADIFPGRPTKEFKNTLRDASPDFRKGWEDGCETGMSGGSNNFYRMFYRNNVADGYKMTSSPDYKSAWGNAFWYCYRYDYIKQKSSIWGSTFSGYQ